MPLCILAPSFTLRYISLVAILYWKSTVKVLGKNNICNVVGELYSSDEM